MNYTLHQLQVFLKITELKSITKAAEALHLTQPAVSIQMKNLQDQFQIPLTEVVGRQLYVTDFGREIAAAAEKILNEVYAINYKTLAYRGQLTGRMKIAVVSTGKYVMPFFLADFLRQHDGIELLLDVTNKAQVLRALESNDVDFALVSIIPEQLKINSITLMDNKLYLVGSGNRETEQSDGDKRPLEQLPLIFRETGSGTRLTMERFLREKKIVPVRKLELNTNEAVKQAVIAGLGYSIMPLIGIRNELSVGSLKVIPVDGLPIQTAWNLIWLKSKNLSPVAEAYVNYILESKQTIIDANFMSEAP